MRADIACLHHIRSADPTVLLFLRMLKNGCWLAVSLNSDTWLEAAHASPWITCWDCEPGVGQEAAKLLLPHHVQSCWCVVKVVVGMQGTCLSSPCQHTQLQALPGRSHKSHTPGRSAPIFFHWLIQIACFGSFRKQKSLSVANCNA